MTDEPEKDGLASRWFKEIENADKSEREWRRSAKEATLIYRNEREDGVIRPDDESFNILWANTETLKPALLNAQPKPDVRQRVMSPDPIARIAAELIQRSLDVITDEDDFYATMQDVVADYALPGRGTVRVRYEPDISMTTGPDGNEYEQIKYERAPAEFVPWDRFLVGPAKRWNNVPWVAYEHHLTRKDLEEKFPKYAKDIPLVIGTKEGDRTEDDQLDPDDVRNRARVYEIWDKETKRIIWIAQGFTDNVLKVEDDPLGLKGFFDCPRPILAVQTTDKLVPICEYSEYRAQAKELNEVSKRIQRLVTALKSVGIYDSTMTEASQIASAQDNDWIAAQNVAALLEKGGIEKMVMRLPIKEVAEVVVYLYQQRDQIKSVIYEITGMSDIIRGASNPNETATAQQLKSQYGGLRLRNRQQEVQRLIRDTIRLQAEVVCEKFQPQTILAMTGVQVPPEIQAQVFALIKSDAMRCFRIDIETDSTIAADEQADKQSISELFQAMGGFVNSMMPAVQTGVISQEQMKTLILAGLRRFRLGSQVEDVMDQAAPQGPDPMQLQQQLQQAQQQMQQMQQQLQQAQSGIQEAQIKAQADAQATQMKLQADAQASQQKLQVEQQTEGAKLQGQIALERIKQQAETQREQMRIAAEQQLEQMRLENQRQIEAMRVQYDAQIKQQEAALDIAKQQASAQIAQESQQNMMANMESLVKGISAPKRIIRDGDGRAVGVEVVA